MFREQPMPKISIGDGGAPFAEAFANAWRDGEALERDWAMWLRAYYHVDALTPDDGWVDRERNSLTFPHYARFVDPHCGIGSIVALGASGCYRLVRLTKAQQFIGLTYYDFEPLEVRVTRPDKWQVWFDPCVNKYRCDPAPEAD